MKQYHLVWDRRLALMEKILKIKALGKLEELKEVIKIAREVRNIFFNLGYSSYFKSFWNKAKNNNEQEI